MNNSSRGRSLRVHSVLFRNAPERVSRAVAHLDRAAELALRAGAVSEVELLWGDCSPTPVLSEATLAELQASARSLAKIDVRFFDQNLGSAAGHNRLLEGLRAEWALIMNPDVLLAPDALVELTRPLEDPTVGVVEARQLPIEHPKDYDLATGETGWASTACALVPRRVLQRLEGFDAAAFFLYGDDVDFSWRARLAGYKILYQPSAVVFHDKRITPELRWAPSAAEKYYSAEAALLLAHKYSRPARVRQLLRDYQASDVPEHVRAAEQFEARRGSGALPLPIDPQHSVSELDEHGHFTRHRYRL